MDHTLLLECYHPSVKLTEPPLFCTYMETPGLGDELSNIDSIGPSKVAGNIEKMRSLYSIFRPHRSQKERRTNRHPAGDVPGSRTHPSSTQNNVYFSDDKEVAHQLLTLDGSELFTQLCSVVNLVKLGPRHGIFQCIVEVDESVVRVYRDWLADMASSQGFTKNRSKFRDEASSQFPLVDPEDKNIVWAGSKKNIGLRFKITERTIRRDKPVLMYADEDSTVTYDIEYEGKKLHKDPLGMSSIINACFCRAARPYFSPVHDA